jgi:cytoskeletal protein RodZ
VNSAGYFQDEDEGRGKLFMDESLGQYLKRMRTEKGYSLSDISAMTCIGIEYLAAVEAEYFQKLPAHTVTKSYVRTYARCLRLNEPEVMKRFAETSEIFYRDREIAARAATVANTPNSLKSRLDEFVSNLKLLF